MDLEGRHSFQGKPETEVGVGSWAGPLFPLLPGVSNAQASAAASHRDSLDHPVLLVLGPEQGSQASLSWRSGPLAPTKSLGFPNPEAENTEKSRVLPPY